MFNSKSIITIVATEDFGARYCYAPMKGAMNHSTYGPEQGVAGNAEACALLVAAHTLEQYIANFDAGKWYGKLALIMPRNASIRVNHIRGLLNSGNDANDIAELCADKISGSFEMSDAHKAAITAFAIQMEQFLNEDGLDIRSYDAFNLNHWRVEGENLADGMEIKLGQIADDGQTFSATADGSVVCENNGVTGTFTVKAVREGRKNVFVIDREANEESNYGKRLMNVRKVMSKTMALLPADVDIDTINDVEADEVAC